MWQCDFALDNLCGAAVLADEDSFDWLLRTGRVPSVETGPSQAFSGDYYVYTEATGKNTGDVSVYVNPKVYYLKMCPK